MSKIIGSFVFVFARTTANLKCEKLWGLWINRYDVKSR